MIDQQTPTPLRAAGVVVLSDSAVLLLQRPDGTWGIPGGKLEEGETPALAAVRETFEESGISLTVDKLVPLACVCNADGYEFTAYAASIDRCEVVMADGEHSAWQWAPVSALPAPLHLQNEALIALALQAPVVAAMDAAVDVNGWAEFPDNPISLVGVYPYSGKQIVVQGMELDPGKIYNVLRPEEELSKQSTIDSFKLVPWIAGHTMLGKGLTPAEQKGVGGVIGEKVYFKNGGLYGNLKMFSSGHAALIAQGLKDLSLGYRCTYEYAPGTFNGVPYDFVQRDIRGNHVATVPDGRMGPSVAVQDSFTFDAKEETQMADENKDENQVQKLDLAAMTLPELLKLMEDLQPVIKQLQDAAAAASGATPAATGTEPASGATPAATGDNTDAGATSPANAATVDEDDKEKRADAIAEDAAVRVMRKLADAGKLAKNLIPHVGVFDHSEMTAGQVAAYGCKKLGLTVGTGQDAATLLAGYMAAANQRVTTVAQDAAEPAGKRPDFLAKHLDD